MRPLHNVIAASGALLVLLVPATLQAQFRGPSRGGDGGRNFDFNEMLRGMDANHNGMIDPSELNIRSSGFVRRAAERAGLDMKQPMAIDKLAAAMQQSREEDRSRGDERRRDEGRRDEGRRDESRRDEERRSDRDRSPNPPPAGNGNPSAVKTNGPAPTSGVVSFGTPITASAGAASSGSLEQRFEPRVIGYADRLLNEQDKNKDGYIDSEEWKAGNWSKSSPPESSDLNKDNRLSKEELCIRIAKRYAELASGGNSDARRFAESMIKQYDKNGDGKLQREEWLEMRPEHQTADTNADGVISADELAVKLASYGGGSSPGSSSGPRGTTSATVGRSHRALMPAERLPGGLPSWFLEKDANQDGQVMMSEYAVAWSDETAAEFARYDLNGDGCITAKECLKQAEKR